MDLKFLNKGTVYSVLDKFYLKICYCKTPLLILAFFFGQKIFAYKKSFIKLFNFFPKNQT